MAYICETMEIINGIQTYANCSHYVDPSFNPLYLTGAQARVLYYEFAKLLAVFLVFSVAAKAAKSL
ncbi:hypothetical protein GWP85_03200 [Acinetobacter beijerinckii]|uniref:hypothetical protein n=1 Tax=Acinetobacter beijerinckii TaxID=262668 RepID=UPI0023DD9EB0|nr:hypothetical protein [Acinetobacter beijerinckii]MDF2416522.1 hypothetical protein [Acinetobacter beijerinckii]